MHTKSEKKNRPKIERKKKKRTLVAPDDVHGVSTLCDLGAGEEHLGLPPRNKGDALPFAEGVGDGRAANLP